MNLLLVWVLLFQEPSDIREQVNVNYRQIQVRVQDREGVPIRKLGADAFVVQVNGKVIVPQSFLEIGADAVADVATAAPAAAGAPGEAAPATAVAPEAGETSSPRSVAIVLDPGMSTAKGFQVMRQAALDLIDGLPADTRIAAYQIRASLRTLSPLTLDRAALRRQIEGSSYFADLWSKLEPFQKNIVQEIDDLYTPRFSEKTGGSRTLSTYGSLTGLLQLKGQVKDGYANKLASSLDTIGRGLVNLPGERSIYLLTAGGYSDDENRGPLHFVCAQLNWQNIPVHALHFRDQDTQDLSMVRMGRLTEMDLRAMQGSLQKSGHAPKVRGANSLDENEDALKVAPRTWAQETGGTYATAFNPLQVAEKLKRLEQGAGHYYLISYPTASSLDEVEIRLATPQDGWDLRYGRMRGKIPSVLGASGAEKAADFASTLMYGFPHHDTGVEWAFQHFRLTDGTFVFPVLGHLEGRFPEGGYELGLVALDEQGAVIDERKTEIRKPGSESVLEFYDLLATRARPSVVRALIREKKTGKSSLEEWFLEDLELDAIGLSSVVLVPSGPHEVFAIHALNRDEVKLDKTKIARERLDPLIKAGGKRISMTGRPFAQGQPMGLYFHAQRLDGGLNQYDLEIHLQQNEQTLPAQVKMVKVDPLAPDGAEMMAVLDTTKLQPGSYVLAMRLRDKRTGTYTAYRERPFTLN